MTNKRVSTAISAVLGIVLFGGTVDALAVGGASVGWTLSSSSTDPFENVGSATSDALTLYLWLYCARPETEGVQSAHVWIEGVMDVFSFVGQPGVAHTSAFPGDLEFTLPACPSGSMLVGELKVRNLAGNFEVCLGPRGTLPPGYGVLSCDDPSTPLTVDSVGYSTSSIDPCVTDWGFFFLNGCNPLVSVDIESWAETKSLYME
jgi:hypothetical protein